MFWYFDASLGIKGLEPVALFPPTKNIQGSYSQSAGVVSRQRCFLLFDAVELKAVN